jgi:hypothetical protein
MNDLTVNGRESSSSGRFGLLEDETLCSQLFCDLRRR